MDSSTERTKDIELVGFSPRERTLIASIFKVSEMRPRMYREWQQNQKLRPDCMLLDIDAHEGRTSLDLAAMSPAGPRVVTIGKDKISSAAVAAHIPRPIRWAGVLHTLDTVFGAMNVADLALSGKQVEQISDAENELELLQLDSWYQHGPVKVFKTQPAVLVVDPDPTGGQYVAGKLAGTGYRVDFAATAAEAIKLLATHRYNCAILETRLPDSDGFDICKMLKESDNRRRTASIILTTSRNPIDRLRGTMAGCDAYLNKPVRPEKLLQTLEKFLPDWRMES
jgi:two-component system cell cycle response regulator